MILILNILSALITLGLIGFAVLYTPHRLSRLFGLRRPRLVTGLVAAAIILALVTMMALHTWPSPLVGVLTTALGLLFGLFVYCFLLMLLFDLLRRWLRFPDRAGAWLVVGLAIIITVYGAWRADGFIVTETDIPIAGLEHEVTLMHISDLHIGHHRGQTYLEKIVQKTNQHRPDLVLLNGDLVDSNSALRPGVMSALSRFEAPAYATTGNHEHYVDTARALETFADHRVRMLHNDVVETHGIQLVGLDYMNADENTFDMHAVNKMTIKAELPKIPLKKDLPVILMHHSPVGLEYVAAGDVSLMLSGHTHAGQIFPATLATQLLFPLNKGLHRIGDTYFFVSQGAGTYAMRLRLGSRNEINLIRLRKAKEADQGLDLGRQ